MTKVLFVTDAPWMPTGYGRVMQNTLPELVKEGFETHLLSKQHYGLAIDWFGTTVHPTGQSSYAYDVFPKTVDNVKPDVVIPLCDIGWLPKYAMIMNVLKKDGAISKGTELWGYVPVDTIDIPWDFSRNLKMCDKVIAMSKYGVKKIKEMGLNPAYIPHGVDTNKFKPLKATERKHIRDKTGFTGKFVVGSVGVNQRRKMWNLMLKGFTKFAKGKDDVRFLLHTDKMPREKGGWNIPHIAQNYGISEKILFTHPQEPIQQSKLWRNDFAVKQMNEVYNLFDVFSMNGAEGFGIPTIESQATETMNISGNQTATSELIKHGKLVPMNGKYEGENGASFGKMDVDKYAGVLEWAYNNRSKVRKMGEKARKHVIKTYDWKKIKPIWIKLLDDL